MTMKRLVLDTAPFFKSTPLRDLSQEYYTIPEVLEEIKDASSKQNAIQYLGLLQQVDLKIKTPSLESMQFVISFAKKTGDFPVLSTTDLKVIALAHTLECELNGGKYLRSEPKQALTNLELNQKKKRMERNKKECGQGLQLDSSVHVEKDTVEAKFIDESSVNQVEETVLEDKLKSLSLTNHKSQQKEQVSKTASSSFITPPESPQKDQDNIQIEHDTEQSNAENLNLLEKESLQIRNDANFTMSKTREEEKELKDDEDDDDDDGWITPKNIQKKKQILRNNRKNNHEQDLNSPASETGCMTSDYAMQNVLLQMNLTLVSTDGMKIDQLKTYVLRCHACYKVTKDMEKKFCPSCGNSTLIRTSVGVDQDGNVIYYLKKNFQYNLRGTKYSIPLSKGGKKNQDLILREDQKEYQNAIKQSNRAKKSLVDIFDPDYVPLDSLSLNKGNIFGPVIGYGRKNPNEKRRKR